MGRGKPLSTAEKAQIEILRKKGEGKREIARQIDRSDHVVRNYLSSPATYCQKKPTGRRKRLSDPTQRKIINAVSNSTKSCNEVKRELDLNVSKSTIWRTIQHAPHIVREKLLPVPRLLPRHKEARLEFGRNNMSRDWTKVVNFVFT
jgi:transposase